MIVSKAKVRIFHKLYHSKGWLTTYDLESLDIFLRIIQINIKELADDGAILRVQTRPSFRYKSDESCPKHKEMLEYCEIYGLDINKDEKEKCG